MAVCDPLRVDHLDYNTVSDHDVANILPSSTLGKAWIIYTSELNSGVPHNDDGIFMREYDPVAHSLGPVVTINDDWVGASRIGTGGAIGVGTTGNQRPCAVRMSDGRFVVAYNASASNGVYVKESDTGTSWSAEHQLIVPVPTNPGLHNVVGIGTDGEDVFILTQGANLPILSALYLFRRISQGNWAPAQLIFPAGSSLKYWRFSENAYRSMSIRRVRSYPTKAWAIAVFGHKRDETTGPETEEVAAYWCDSFDESGGGSWTKTTIHDFAGELPEDRGCMVRVGNDDRFRMIYLNYDATKTKVYAAYSSSFGTSWSDIGLLTVPNATYGWDPSFSRTIALDGANNWHISTMASISGTIYWARYKSTTEDDTTWAETVCTINKSLPAPNDYKANSVYCVGDAVFVGTSHVRICSDSSGTYYRIWVLRALGEGENGDKPGDEPDDNGTNYFRRGVIQASRMPSSYPRGQYTVTSIENAKRLPGGG